MTKIDKTIAIISLLIALFLPTTKQFLTIISVSYVTQNEKIVTTADKLVDMLEGYLDKKLGGVKEMSKLGE